MQQMRGVNLGGWLVCERWMSPSIFRETSAQDEYSLCSELGKDEAQQRLQAHRETFITEEHVKQLAELGLKLLRVPVGYWLFDAPQPYVGGGREYIDRLFVWAKRYDLYIILDFHAAPGSQNGWDHSGKAGKIEWHQADNIAHSLSFIKKLAETYGQEPSLIGIEVLNEPHWQIPLDTLASYYQQAHGIIRDSCHSDVKVICADGFRALDMAKRLSTLRREGVMLDIHLYQLFTDQDRALNLDGHMKKASQEWKVLLTKLNRYLPVIIGEWSAAMSELSLPIDQPPHTRQYTASDYVAYFKAQQRVFELTGTPWTYWTARTENRGPWSLLEHPKFLRIYD